ncbi:MAG: ferrochelatase [Thermodesulfobacteriota bacterium]
MDQPYSSIGVLLMAFGGPSSAKEVEPFLQKVLGQGVPTQRLQEAKRRYRLIGGCSPLPEITFRQASALENNLNAQDPRFKVYVGMRHWHPCIAETLGEILRDRIRRVAALSLNPYQSKMSTEPYVVELQRAIADSKAEIEVSMVKGWNTHPLFLQALAEKLKEGLLQFPVEVRHRVYIIFSAHSLPKKGIIGDPYVEQIEATIRGIEGITGSLPWRLAFQSRGGEPGGWLDPEVSAVLQELMEEGHREVLMVPLGFVSDNLETLYDIDILYRQQAESMGMSFRRSPSLNDCDTFIEALSHIVHEHLANVT